MIEVVVVVVVLVVLDLLSINYLRSQSYTVLMSFQTSCTASLTLPLNLMKKKVIRIITKNALLAIHSATS